MHIYVHCYNHKLHLVVVNAISENDEVSSYFDTCSNLYHFTRRHNVSVLYEGKALQRLLLQRWTAHLLTTAAILDNYEELISLLKLCADSRKYVDISNKATGLLSQIHTLNFLFIA